MILLLTLFLNLGDKASLGDTLSALSWESTDWPSGVTLDGSRVILEGCCLENGEVFLEEIIRSLSF